MTLVVILSVRADKLAEFRTFEKHAAELIRKHGGALERSVFIAPRSSADVCKEVHIVTFPSEQHFLTYQKDEALREIMHLRRESVVETEILVGEDGPSYAEA